MTISIVGMGLIGGSLAKDLRANGLADRLIGVEADARHACLALELGLADAVLPLEEACAAADLVVLAAPVGALLGLMPKALDAIRPEGVVCDMGSTKAVLARSLEAHPRRSRAVLAHPMAGTEFSGPQAAVSNLFQGRVAILCDTQRSDPDAVQRVERLFKSLFMRLVQMDPEEHDRHAAYVSHVSHITSFVLALTVLEKEKSEAQIFNLAAGGFASTVRLAKSSPRMWRDIYEQNSSNIADVLDSYIEKMQQFRDHIRSGAFDATYELMHQANDIGRILK